jgi:hypothetical protein
LKQSKGRWGALVSSKVKLSTDLSNGPVIRGFMKPR